MQLTLIRHSKTIPDPNEAITAWRLSDVGIVKAKEFSKLDLIKKIDTTYTSLQRKAIETAINICEPNNIPVDFNKNLTETTSFTNKFLDDVEEKSRQYLESEVDSFADGETTKEALKRFMNALDQIVFEEKAKGNNNVGIVSHGTILALFSTQFVDKTAYEIHKQIQMPDIAVFDWDKKKFGQFWGENT